MFVCDRRGISCLNRQCERYHVARGGQLTLYGSGLSLRLRVYVTVPGGRERMCENQPNYSTPSPNHPEWSVTEAEDVALRGARTSAPGSMVEPTDMVMEMLRLASSCWL